MSKFIWGIVIAATPILIASLDMIAPQAVASPACMTLDEARKAFPSDHLYWHTPKRCWDNVSKSGKKKPAADAKTTDATTAPDANDKPAKTDQPSESVKPAETKQAAAAQAPAVPFIAGDPSRLAFWSAPSRSASEQDEPQPAPAAQDEAASLKEANVVIGAPDAKPGSPAYLLEHCCWPPPAAADTADAASMLPRMAIASAGAFGLAAGLWLFVYRRRRPRLNRLETAPSIYPERNVFMHDAVPEEAYQPHDLDMDWQPETPDSTLAMYAPKRLRSAAREPYRVS